MKIVFITVWEGRKRCTFQDCLKPFKILGRSPILKIYILMFKISIHARMTVTSVQVTMMKGQTYNIVQTNLYVQAKMITSLLVEKMRQRNSGKHNIMVIIEPAGTEYTRVQYFRTYRALPIASASALYYNCTRQVMISGSNPLINNMSLSKLIRNRNILRVYVSRKL